MSKFGLAAVCDSPNTPLELREYAGRDVEADEVLVRVTMGVPVIGVGRINDPLMADRLLTDGVCDLVGVVRANIAGESILAAAQAVHGSIQT